MQMVSLVAAYATTSLTTNLLPLICHPVSNEHTFVPPFLLAQAVSSIALMIAFFRESITEAFTSARATRMVMFKARCRKPPQASQGSR
jgi:hypothetical protein